MTEQSIIKENAEFLRLGLLAGVVDLPQVVSWADSILLEQKDPSPEIIDLSMAKTQGEVFTNLGVIQGEFYPRIVFKRLPGKVYEFAKANPGECPDLAQRVYRLTVEIPYRDNLEEDLVDHLMAFEDWFYDAKLGTHGSVKQFTKEFIEFLETAAKA